MRITIIRLTAAVFLCVFCVPAFFQEKQDAPETPLSAEMPPASQTVSSVTIEQASKTSYINDKENDTEIIKFSGDVVISVVKDDKKVVIRAQTVNFDRKRSSLFASGGVSMEQFSEGQVSRSVTADSILFNTDTLEGIFNAGRVVHRQQESVKLPEGASLIVSADVLARGESETVTFKRGELTFCDDENPHWKIRASRIWLLPGNEFAFANALLYVGAVPLMYFPFFYYPKDELFFNPAFGYRPREGYFVQTTTYFMGRKPLQADDKTSKGFNFMQPSALYEQELNGLVLRNLDKETSPPSYFLKFIGDYYSTLGGMFGISGDFKPSQAVTSLSFNMRLGLSNTVYPVEGYTQYISYSSSKRKNADYGWFFGLKLPFRYAFSFKTNIQKNGFSFAASLPLYSDPYFETDFGDRKESMDWIDFFLKGAFSGAGKKSDVVASSVSSSTAAAVSSYTWNTSGSYTPNISLLRPWIDSLSLSSFSSSVLFSQQKTPQDEFGGDKDWYTYSPNRDFFYPVQIKPLDFSITLSGTLIKLPAQKNAAAKHNGYAAPDPTLAALHEKMAVPDTFSSSGTEEAEDAALQHSETPAADNMPASGQSVALVQAGHAETAAEHKAQSGVQTGAQTELQSESDPPLADADGLKTENLPDIPMSAPADENKDMFLYTLSYTLRPAFSSLLTYSAVKPSAGGTTAASFDFKIHDPKSSEISFKAPLDINGKFSWYADFFSLSNAVSFFPQYQTHPVLSSLYSKAEQERIILNDYMSRKVNITNSNSLSVKPLIFFPVFKNSSVSWNTSVKLLESVFTGTAEKPAWKYPSPEWNDKTLTSHNLNAVFSAQEGAFAQRLSFQANLPPLTDSYTAKAEFTFPFAETSLETGYRKRENRTDSQWYFLPLVQTASLTFFKHTREGKENKNKLAIAQRFEYNMEDKHAERFSTGVSWRSMRVTYEMLHGYFYNFDARRGWVASAEKKFLPYLLSFHTNISNLEFTNKKKNIACKPGVATVVSWNMVKPTDSYFTFTPSLTFKINDFLNLTFSAESRNTELLRYMQKAVGFTPEIPGERNIFIDLYNSFAFWDEQKRSTSGFKIKYIKIKLEHDLHDWVLNSEFKLEPRIVTSSGGKKYDYKPYFMLSVHWKPMQGIKALIRDEYGEFILNPAK